MPPEYMVARGRKLTTARYEIFLIDRLCGAGSFRAARPFRDPTSWRPTGEISDTGNRSCVNQSPVNSTAQASVASQRVPLTGFCDEYSGERLVRPSAAEAACQDAGHWRTPTASWSSGCVGWRRNPCADPKQDCPTNASRVSQLGPLADLGPSLRQMKGKSLPRLGKRFH